MKAVKDCSPGDGRVQRPGDLTKSAVLNLAASFPCPAPCVCWAVCDGLVPAGLGVVIIYPCLFSACFTGAQRAESERTTTAPTDTTSAAPLSTGSGIIMLIITETVLCLLPPARGAAPSGGPSRLQTLTSTRGSETPSLSLTPHAVTCTETTEGGTWTEATTTAAAAPLIPPSPDTPHPKGTLDRLLKPLIPRRERLCLLVEEHDLSPGAGRPALTLSAAPAARAVEGGTATVVIALVHSGMKLTLIFVFPWKQRLQQQLQRWIPSALSSVFSHSRSHSVVCGSRLR